MSDKIFLLASRQRLRFPSPQGLLSVEDLWDLPLMTERPNKASIEGLGAALLTKQHDLGKVQSASILTSFEEPSTELKQVNLQVAILREIARIRQEEIKAKTTAEARRTERERLADLIRMREGAEMPIEELKKRLAELDG